MLNRYHIMGYKCIISTFQQLKEDALALNRKKRNYILRGKAVVVAISNFSQFYSHLYGFKITVFNQNHALLQESSTASAEIYPTYYLCSYFNYSPSAPLTVIKQTLM